MHPQLSPVAAQMRLDDLAGRHQLRAAVPRSARTARPGRSFGRRRSTTRSPVVPALAATLVAPIAALPDSRACSDAVRDQCVA